MPTKDKKHFMWAYNNILKNKGKHEVFVCSIADNCNDDTAEYFKSLGEFDDHFKYIINDTGEDWGCAYGYNKILKELVDTDVFFIMHTDMYLGPGVIDTIERYIEPNMMLSICRVEPPIHTSSDDKLQVDFGTSIEDFREGDFLKFAEYKKQSSMGKFIDGAFAPSAAYKVDYEKIGYHDDIIFRPFMFEDSDFVQRFVLNGGVLRQYRETFVYHFTCKSWRHKNGSVENLSNEDFKYYENINVNNARNFVRKWGIFFKSDEKTYYPQITGRYDIGFVVNNCDQYMLALLEPWCDNIYTDLNYSIYYNAEQKNTAFDLRKRLKSINDEKTNDVIVEFDAKQFTQESFNLVDSLQYIVEKTNKVGEFKYDIFNIKINRINDHRMELVNLKSDYYFNKLLIK